MPHDPARAKLIPADVRRQIVLPLSKAIEIAYKSIRQRLSRSLLVTSGIVLALAFLMSILVNNCMIAGMRQWAVDFPKSTQCRQLQDQAGLLQDNLKLLGDDLHEAAGRVQAVPQGGGQFDPAAVFGATFDDLQKTLGGQSLPASPDELISLLSIHPQLVGDMRRWLDAAAQLKAVRDRILAPQRLQELMHNAGVPATSEEIAASQIQTRWLVGLALLVAFVGILNAMLMSVTERFREIGTMKCLGALDSFIIKLFLIESLFQGGVGTAIGIVLGMLLSMAGMSGRYGWYAWMNVPKMGLLHSVMVCFAVGVGLTVAGAVYPAWQAARMQPVDAMRVEA